MHSLIRLFVATAVLGFVQQGMAQSLKGSRASMEKQHQEAVRHGYTFIDTARVVNGLVESGDLLKVVPNRYFALHDVSYPYARAPVKTFVERLSAQYYAACGEKMTVTSLTRPIDRQPANASSSSVHPTGMAVDLRIPSKQNCRSWLEKALLSLEAAEVLDVTRERNPPHYHVAVYPTTYQNYVASLSESTSSEEYVVRRGDTLSKIATRTGTSIQQLRAVNGIRGDLINVGQKLQIVTATSTPAAAATTASAATTAAAISVAAVNSATNSAANKVAAVSEVNHRVQRGETLWRIANRYGITVDGLQQENGLADELLQVGQVLKVKVGGVSR